MTAPVKPGVYQHFKGKMYRVHGIAKHSETGEDLVIYESLYPSNQKFWARPVAMFNEAVGDVMRFTFLHD